MYIIKIRGKAKIPDYIQIRGEDFTLIEYFRVDRPLKNLSNIGLSGQDTFLQNLINSLPFGKLRLRAKGSSAGHNGLKNIEEVTGGNNYARLKFGLGGINALFVLFNRYLDGLLSNKYVIINSEYLFFVSWRSATLW